MAESRLLAVATEMGLPNTLEVRLANYNLGQVTAEELNTAFLADIQETANSVSTTSGIRVAVHAEPLNIQNPGEQIERIFDQGFASGVDSLCIVGTSVPHLPARYLLEAFGRMAQHRGSIVLGPTDGGGYYLIGASSAAPSSLLKDISWGTAKVLRETLQRAVTSELSVSLLPSLQEVALPEHLERLLRDLRRGVAIAPRTQYLLRNIGLE